MINTIIFIIILVAVVAFLAGFLCGWVGYWMRSNDDRIDSIYQQELKQYKNNQN